MPLTITGDLIASDSTAHTARPIPSHPHDWQVTRLPGRLLDRNTAITAMVLADAAARDPHPGHQLWPHIHTRAAELNLPAAHAIAPPSQPPRHPEAASKPADREATGP